MRNKFVLIVKRYILFLIILYPFILISDTCNFPFPQQVTYPYGIKPTNYTQAQMNQHCQQWFDQWRAYYVHGRAQDPWMAADEYRVVRHETGDNNTEDTVSEGIGYGMIITVYMSSATNNTKQYFDGMWKFYRRYRNGNGLMNWRIGDGGGVIGPGAATDADEDAAFALMMAHYQWGSTGAINYRQEALTLINAILNNEITGSNDIRPGDGWDFGNISYFAPAYYRMFGDFAGNTRWHSVASRTYNTIINYYRNHADTYNPSTELYTWLMPNWCNYDGTRNDSNDGWAMDSYSYWWDACRTPWRLTYDYLLYGTLNHAYAYQCPATISQFFRTRYSGNAGNIKSHYELNGAETTYCRGDRTPDLCDEDVMCLPPVEGAIACAAMVEGNQAWLNNAYDRLVQFTFPTDTGVNWGTDYFADILKMLYLLVLTGNMKNPLGDYPTATPTFTWDTRTPTYTHTPTVAANVFDDFETGTLVNLNLPSGQGGFTSVVNSATNPRYGVRSCQITSVNNSGWGGFSIDTPYGGAKGYRDFRGATTIEFDVYSTANFTGFIKVIEAVNPGDPGGQDWSNRNNQFTVQSGAWRHISINLNTLTIDSYSPSGDSTFDLAYIQKFFLQIDSPPNATIYIDHIIFGGSIVTETPTITATRTRTPAGTATNTPYYSPTRTATNSPYLSPTNTRTSTPYLSPTVTRTFTISPTFSVTPVFTPIRVNCAGPQYIGGGLTWAADKAYTAGSWGYQGGSTADRGSIAIANTTDDPLYQTERYGNPTYRFDIPNGTYEVTLKFAETNWTSIGARIFDVLIEGVTVIDNLDIYAQVGSNYAYDRIFVVEVTDGQLTITMTSTADTGEINAIQVIRFVPTPTRTPSYTRTNSYTPTYTRTPSQTRTRTPTYTSTNSQTPANSFTPTRTATPPATSTYTRTPTGTATFTYTITWTASPTWTRTFTASATRTASPTWTRTPTVSLTFNVPSSTFTNTRTITPTNSQLPTNSFTPTFTATSTNTRTRTPTWTISPTYSVSPTITQTWTGTPPTSTVTPTITSTSTQTATPTATPTFTFTATVTGSPTYSNTVTQTQTNTRTVSFTSTRTSTATNTITQTHSITPTYTATPTGILPSPTNSPTFSVSPSITPSVTRTFTATATPTYTQTHTPTFTPTLTGTSLQFTFTTTPTITPSASENKELKIENIVIYPNPYNPGGVLNIGFLLTQNSKTIKIKIWTSGFRLIKSINYLQYNTGPNTLIIDSRQLANLANGVYFITIEAVDSNSIKTNSKPQVLVVIK